MFPRVAFEYGHTWCAPRTIALRDLGILDLRERHVEHHAELEPALLGRRSATPGCRSRRPRPRPARAARARRSRPRSTPRSRPRTAARVRPATLVRRPQLDVQRTVVGHAVPLGAPAGHRCLRRVDRLRHRCLLGCECNYLDAMASPSSSSSARSCPHLRRAHALVEPRVELGDELAHEREDLAPARGGADELGAPVGRVGHALDVAVLPPGGRRAAPSTAWSSGRARRAR